MTAFESLFYNIFSYYKPKQKQNATRIAVFYITLLQVSILLLLGVFFAGFFRQMNIVMLLPSKAWLLFSITAIFIYFKNWMQYTGKRRMMITAKMNKKKVKSTYNIYILWALPIAIFALTYVVFQAS